MNASRIMLTIGLCMLLFQGTAYAIIGVDDNVPAQELIFPFICEGHIGTDGHPVLGGLNTLWAFAETEELNTRVRTVAHSRKGVVVFDYDQLLTPLDVGSDTCTRIIANMPPAGAQLLVQTISGKDYFVGYLTLTNISGGEDNLIGWVTLSNVPQWAAANFKPYQAEGGADPATFAEGMGAGPIYADSYFLRYYIGNSLSDTSNWWIVLKGRNYCDSRPAGTCTSLTKLSGIICNEEEVCLSSAGIPVPDRLNIINVENILPGAFRGYPKSGFASFRLIEVGRDLYSPTIFVNEDFTAFMWSYQRLQNTSTISYPVDPKKQDKFDSKYGIIYDNNVLSIIDPADRRRR